LAVVVVVVIRISSEDEGPATDAPQATAHEDGLSLGSAPIVATPPTETPSPANVPVETFSTVHPSPAQESTVSRASLDPAAAPESPSKTRFPYKRDAALFEPKEPGKDKIADPLARAALALVGVDRDAEAYWIEAINDANLAEQERQDLIEDLNEDGLSDADNPGQEDLPMIANRLRLIEHLLPSAMDRVNVDAFLEAQKDLLIMQDRLTAAPG
jgi:hypothetical protein